MEEYKLKVAGLERNLPIIPIAENIAIASFVMLGDTDLVEKCAQALYDKLPVYDIDLLVCPEAKAIPLTQSLAQLMKVKYVVVRKSIKTYMGTNPIIRKVMSITTKNEQILVLDQKDANAIEGRNVCIIDDVVSTGRSLKAVEDLVEQVGGNCVCVAAALLEDAGYVNSELIYLEKLPIFKKVGEE